MHAQRPAASPAAPEAAVTGPPNGPSARTAGDAGDAGEAGEEGANGLRGGALRWIDSHCHLDAPEFAADRRAVMARARAAGVQVLVLPAVRARDFEALRGLAQAEGCAYALGLHPLYVGEAAADDLDRLAEALRRHRDDPRLVAVGEIGLDHFVPGLDRALQERFYLAQLRLARDAGLPVILHVRRSADALLAGLARFDVPGGIAHAFNGSEQQARRFAERGFRLGFGGAMTFERARQIRTLAAMLPAGVPVLETDAPDIPPWWLYTKAGERSAGGAHGRNEPAELPRIGATLAELRGWSIAETAERTSSNVHAALPRLAGA
ncbi:MAG: TatD family hydrolase, partial [Rubrivivax sp.]|nr:TatD family hydrolase [Rubrivivax sp.]